MIDSDPVEYCGSCTRQWSLSQVQKNYLKCPDCGSVTVSWATVHVSHTEIHKIWARINGDTAEFKARRLEASVRTSELDQSRLPKVLAMTSHNINATNIGAAMSQRIEGQIELLDAAKSRYQALSESIVELIAEAKRIVASLSDDELNHDYVTYLQEFNEALLPALFRATEQIDDDLQAALSSKIRYLEERR